MGTRSTTPFTRESTAAEVIAGVDLTGKRAIVTGGASGIGVETARALAHSGAEVTIAARNLEAAEKVAAEVGARAAHLDLADRASVAAFAADWQGPLHILVNNAGVMASPLTRTPEGWELQFGTNHLGHFRLTLGLHRALAAAGGARVVSVSSSAHLMSGVDFEDLHFERRPYDPWVAYGQSKTANILFAVEGAQRWAADGIEVNALMPGGIRTGLQRHVESDPGFQEMVASSGMQWKTTEQGAATSVLLAGSPLVAGISGRYFEDSNEALPNVPGERRAGVASYALDTEAAKRLWDVSVALLNS
ncbi:MULTISPECIES: SDR family NAD(P)-dependent oxidoreductase [unclassified Crossiella]|uniref:SDR family NAD(P)-dependent oxidoreductase n=1 Tax=unclassified Crossiella TaxID=2620835 RepID=UPI001FFFD289|nr:MULTISPECIES: SDR family NAD(P)-dependent oxidoreductase [unclassified Crossiella]MCK2237621.1 SDR family NAD(P)-dependent oxidoreductase [Crossiella sp. S99.2]MCK2254907.1 SDR family NAD(P)-dependent oxidoreductase [Crossiella sp. S99.1]